MKNKIKYSEYLSAFLNFVDSVKSTYESNLQQMKEQENLSQDLLHKLELEETSYKERNRIATQLATNRRERRHFKDVVEELQPIYEMMFESEDAKIYTKTVRMLRETLGKMRRQENYHSNRIYIPKVLKEEGKK